MSEQEFEGRSVAEAAIKACEVLNTTRPELRYRLVSETGEGMGRHVVIAVTPPVARAPAPAREPAAPRRASSPPHESVAPSLPRAAPRVSPGAELDSAAAAPRQSEGSNDEGRHERGGRGRPRSSAGGRSQEAGRSSESGRGSEGGRSLEGGRSSESGRGRPTAAGRATREQLEARAGRGPRAPREPGRASREAPREAPREASREASRESGREVSEGSRAPRAPRAPRGAREPRAPRAPRAPREAGRTRAGGSERPRGGSGHESIDSLLQLEGRPPPPRRPSIAVTSTRAKRALEVVGNLLRLLHLQVDAHLVADGDEELQVDLHGTDEGSLIGRKGEALLALQFILNRMLGRLENEEEAELGPVVVLDAGGYRERRRGALEDLARRLAERAIEAGKAVRMSPMSAQDRRTFHLALKGIDGIVSRSEGEGVYRNLLLVPAEFC